MSATPRPWQPVWNDPPDIGQAGPIEPVAVIPRSAFAALLAVAKAARRVAGWDLDSALAALDAEHPGWREWTP